MERNKAIEIIFRKVGLDDLVLTTTGMISRECSANHDRTGNFYMIGSMGLVSSLGLGIALLNPNRRVFVIEGDGSALMNLGVIPLIAVEAPSNMIHLVLDNEAYESTGGQPSITSTVNLSKIARGAGYKSSTTVRGIPTLEKSLANALTRTGPSLITAKVTISAEHSVPRVSHTPLSIRDRFAGTISSQHMSVRS